MDYIIKNAEIYDPEEGKYAYKDIGIKNGKIEKIDSNISLAKQIIDAKGLSLVPGFIDLHIHEDPIGIDSSNRFFTEECMLRMGVTTVVGGNCGFSPSKIGDYFKYLGKHGSPTNTLLYSGYSVIRSMLGNKINDNVSSYRLGDVYKSLEIYEIDKLKPIIRKHMDEGALGLSFGLEYTPGIDAEEIIRVVEVLSDYNNSLVASHYRYDANRSLESIDESIFIAEKTRIPFQFSHIGSCSAFGYMEESLNKLNIARNKGIDISMDCYPYDAFSTLIGSAVFDEGCFERWGVDYNVVLPTEGKYKGQYCTKEMFNYLRKNEPNTRVVCFVMNELEVNMAYKHPEVMVASDGKIKNGQGHPRGAGTFPRVLGKLVRKDKILSFEEAIKKMTLMPANRLGFKTKGRIKEGCDADITIINKDTIIDNADYMEPSLPPFGLEYVFINGKLALEKGEIVNLNAGKAIRRQDIS